MPESKQVWEHADGIRTSLDNWRFREVIPQSAYLQSYSTPIVEGPVDHLDPAIIAYFRILGKNSPALTPTLTLDTNYLPGFVMKILYDFSLDVPIMIEKLSQDFTADSGATNQVEVLWKGECYRNAFISQTELIQHCGWVILHAEEGYFRHRDTHTIPSMNFTLRRKQLSVTSPPAGVEAS